VDAFTSHSPQTFTLLKMKPFGLLAALMVVGLPIVSAIADPGLPAPCGVSFVHQPHEQL
jgi:hypothetical protein